MNNETPMMEQYHRIKNLNRDSILLFRLGDFYEMFEEDAVHASSILNIALTKRNNVPMCGFPFHAANSYIVKLINEGEKIAICEQLEEPGQTRSIVKRDVVEVISPGMIADPNLLDNKRGNCIAALNGFSKREIVFLACASLDVSTGEFLSSFFSNGDILDNMLNEIDDNGIKEIIYPESFHQSEVLYPFIDGIYRTRSDMVMRELEDHRFSKSHAEEALKSHYDLSSIGAFEFQDELEMVTCGALLSYVKENFRQSISHVMWVKGKQRNGTLIIDNATKKHLELLEGQGDGKEKTSLLSILDKTETAMGGRLLKRYLNNPSRDINEIRNRLEKVEYFYNSPDGIQNIRKMLRDVLDVPRILSKLSVGKGNARDLNALKDSLKGIKKVKGLLEGIGFFNAEISGISDFSDILSKIERAIVEDPPFSIREGGLIRRGYNEKLDQFSRVNEENREWINRYQIEEHKNLGISSLKVRYNKIIGYYVEITKPNLHLVPPHYIKKQTLINAERYTTQELMEHETLLMEARESSNQLEAILFEEIRKDVLEYIDKIYLTSEMIARIDVYGALALTARENNYVKPEIVEDNIIDIIGGRHPVIEKLGLESFIENDLNLNDTDRRIMILTGPNMAGKSTFLRQSALIIIMAHMGSFVPALSAKIGLVDRVFSRIGMSDRLVKGESTFLVEMLETARILRYATNRSFIIMDEIGRGTSTYDGLSIAWAVLEYLLDVTHGSAKVIFATHYHEITALNSFHGVVNYNATVKEWNDRVIFLRKIIPGSASRSYGIEVARMAGIPDRIIERAKTILDELETKYGSSMPLLLSNEKLSEGFVREKGALNDEVTKDNGKVQQLELFPSIYDILARELKGIDIKKITPQEAINILYRFKKSIFL